jgi:hypothetical protein
VNALSPAAPSRRPLLLLTVLFLAPLASAFWLYYGSSWRPVRHTNHGQLIVPVVPLPASAQLTGKWSLVVVGTGESGCNVDCRGALIYARQTWLSLGKLLPRVQRVLLAGEGCCDTAYLQHVHAGLATVPAAGADSAALRRAFPAPQDHFIFVVDPLGNLMMRYDVRENPRGLREDLKTLLELSHIG